MLAVAGVIKGDSVVLENDNVRNYDGKNIILTILDGGQSEKKKESVDWDSFVIPSERGKNVEEYMREMRDNDRF